MFPGFWKLLYFLRLPSQDGSLSLPLLSLFFIFYILSYLLLKSMGCLSGCLVSSASVQKLFCGICSAFRWSFDEFVAEKVVSPCYSSTILGPPPSIVLNKVFLVCFIWLSTICFGNRSHSGGTVPQNLKPRIMGYGEISNVIEATGRAFNSLYWLISWVGTIIALWEWIILLSQIVLWDNVESDLPILYQWFCVCI